MRKVRILLLRINLMQPIAALRGGDGPYDQLRPSLDREVDQVSPMQLLAER
jgi:hypothetical protein